MDIFDERPGYMIKPLDGIKPNDVRVWLLDNDNERSIAMALASTENNTWRLIIEFVDNYESEYPEAEAVIDEWTDFRCELYDKVIMILKEENRMGKASHDIDNAPTAISAVMPFMYRNGFKHTLDYGWVKWWVDEKNSPFAQNYKPIKKEDIPSD